LQHRLLMIKKAAEFRRETVRPKKKSPKSKRKGPRALRSDRNQADSGLPPASHNRSRAAGRKATVALEETGMRPSRKSTRKSANRSKPDIALIRRAEAKASSAKVRARVGK
jgi:hypothetical protein